MSATNSSVPSSDPSSTTISSNLSSSSSLDKTSITSGINTSRWIKSIGGNVPIVFICEDNGLGISVPTPKGWIESTFSNQEHLKYLSCDGLNIFDTIRVSKQAESYCRSNRAPVFLHMNTVRLMGHAGSDIELGYLDENQIENTEKKEFDTQKFSEFKDQFQWFILIGFVLIVIDIFMRDGKTIWLKNLNLFNEK